MSRAQRQKNVVRKAWDLALAWCQCNSYQRIVVRVQIDTNPPKQLPTGCGHCGRQVWEPSWI